MKLILAIAALVAATACTSAIKQATLAPTYPETIMPESALWQTEPVAITQQDQ